MLLIHNSPMGRLHVPGAGVVERGVAFEVPDPIGRSLLQQYEVFSEAPSRKKGSES
ncbi:MAG: hypothetical protein RL430_1371 [Actinomycetota bacterium]|jgi:hypothetical protein